MSDTPQIDRPPLLASYALAVFAFLYLPIVVLIVYSFNRDGVGGFPPKYLTFRWYRVLFSDDAIWDSVLNSLLVAAGAIVLSLTLGLLAALALDRATFPGKPFFRRLVLLPLILPGIITGLSLLMFVDSFWMVRDGVIVHQWNLQNYAKLFENPLYLDVLFRTMRIAASVTLLSLLLGYPLAY